MQLSFTKLTALAVAAVAVVTSTVSATATHASGSNRRQLTAAKQYCRPGQPCWPTLDQWSALNRTINGNLIKVIPWGDPCFGKGFEGYNLGKCLAVEDKYLDDRTRVDQVGIAQFENWGYCYSNEGDKDDCSLQVLAPILGTTIPFRTCKSGRISPYALKVTEGTGAADVAAVLAFAKSKNIKVTIKNTGHEYLGRGTAPDSIMIWTHNLRSISYNANFNGNRAMVLGSGVLAEDAYRAARDYGVDITLGAYSTVGVAGGFAQGGGHGPFGPKYGMAVDNILEYKVVTADGQLRTVNANSNADLYWAMRGGGGGVWGVVLQVVYKVYPATTYIGMRFELTYNLLNFDKDAGTQKFLEELAYYAPEWNALGIVGYDFVNSRRISFNHGVSSDDLPRIAAALKPIVDFAKDNQKKYQWTFGNYSLIKYPNFEAFREDIMVGIAPLSPVAFSERLASRIIPTSQHSTNASRTALAKAMLKAYRDNVPPFSLQSLSDLLKPVDLQLYTTGPRPSQLGGPPRDNNGLGTAWRDMYLEVVLAVGWSYGFSQSAKAQLTSTLTKAADNLRVFGEGTYYSEADVNEVNWQKAFFGDHYDRLVSIKKIYDPESVFTVWKGIGFQGQEASNAFRCYQQD